MSVLIMLVIIILAIVFAVAVGFIVIALVAGRNSKNKEIRTEGQFCTGCGAPLAVDNKYCDKCGKEI